MRLTLRVLAALFGAALVLSFCCGAFGQCPGGVCPARPQQFSMPVYQQQPQQEWQPAAPISMASQPRPPMPAVGMYERQRAIGGGGFGGACFVVSREPTVRQHVLTAAHQIEGTHGPTLTVFPGGKSAWANILEVRTEDDLAILEIADLGIEPLEIADTEPQPGDEVTVCGYPVPQARWEVARGRVTTYAGNYGKPPQQTFLETSARVRQGYSGGPILDRHGRVVGVLHGFQKNNPQVSAGPCLPRLRQALHRVLPPYRQRPKAPLPIPQPIPQPPRKTAQAERACDQVAGAPMTVPGGFVPFEARPLTPIAQSPTVEQHMAMSATVADLYRRVAALESWRVAAPVKGDRGERGPMGPPGPAGIDGRDGKDGRDGVVADDPGAEQARMARVQQYIDARLAELPPLRIQTLDEKGNVHQDAQARLGDLIRLKPVLVGGK